MKRILLVCIAGLIVLGASVPVQAQSGYVKVPDDLVVEFRDSANVVGREILFTDIASVSTSDQRFIDVLKQVSLGPAPSKGYSRKLTAGYIALRLRQRKIDPDTLPFQLPESVIVTSETTILPASSIISAAKAFVAGQMGRPLPDNISTGYVPDLEIPVGSPDIQCALIEASPEREYFVVGASISVNGHAAGFVRVEFGTVNYGTAAMSRGEVQQHVAASRQASSSGASAASAPYLVTRGSIVRVIVRTPFTEITTVAEARGDGRLGDLVEVRNLDTGRRFAARVVSSGVVEVNFGG